MQRAYENAGFPASIEPIGPEVPTAFIPEEPLVPVPIPLPGPVALPTPPPADPVPPAAPAARATPAANDIKVVQSMDDMTLFFLVFIMDPPKKRFLTCYDAR